MQELLDRVSSLELSEWQAFENVHGPIGAARDDILAAIIAHKVVYMMRDPKSKEPKVEDFIPKWDSR